MTTNTTDTPVEDYVAPVQESLFDIGPSDEVGYRVPIACQVAGITYRQLDYWARTNLVRPSIRGAMVPSRRIWAIRSEATSLPCTSFSFTRRPSMS